MRPSRGKKRTAALTVIALTAGLLVLVGQPALSTVQDNINNYFGPAEGAPCVPNQPGWDCEYYSGDVDPGVLTQMAPTLGQNIFRCVGATCFATQMGGVAGIADPNQKPDNTAACGKPDEPNESFEQESSQTCDVDQQGRDNTITAHFKATASNDDLPTLETVRQIAQQTFTTTQDGRKNVLDIIAAISQTAISNLDASTQVTHDQDTSQKADNKMFATSENIVTYKIDRDALSDATGGSPRQLYDDGVGAPGLGQIDLVAKSGGTNKIKVRGTQTAEQQATSLNLGTVRQLIENANGGFLANLTVDTATDNPDGTPDVDIGDPGPGGECGFRKAFKQQASGPAGPDVPGPLGSDVSKEQDILNQIRLPKIGTGSPRFVEVRTCSDHAADRGGDISVHHFVKGHAQESIKGLAFGSLAAGNCEDPTNSNCETREETYGPARDIVFSFDCHVEIGNVPNQEVCPGGESAPVSSASLDVSSDNDDFDGDGRTEVVQGEPFDLLAKVRNNGDSDSQAMNNTVSVPVPASTTVVDCQQACALSEDGTTMTFGLGALNGGQEASGTARLSVDANADPATDIAIPGTARNDQEGELAAPTTATVDVVAAPPPPPKRVALQFPEQPIKTKSGVFPVWVLGSADDGDDSTVNNPADQVNPLTICVGDAPPAGGNPTPGSQPSPKPDADCTESHGTGHVADANGDGFLDLVVHFDAKDAGFDRGDTRGFLTGRLLDDTTWVEGWAADGQVGAPIRTS